MKIFFVQEIFLAKIEKKRVEEHEDEERSSLKENTPLHSSLKCKVRGMIPTLACS
jgi:hypothetical protein